MRNEYILILMSTEYVDRNRKWIKWTEWSRFSKLSWWVKHNIDIVLKISNVMCPLGRPGSSKVLVRTFSPTFEYCEDFDIYDKMITDIYILNYLEKIYDICSFKIVSAYMHWFVTDVSVPHDILLSLRNCAKQDQHSSCFGAAKLKASSLTVLYICS